MAEEVDFRAWDHTAQLSAMLANTARDPKKRSRPFMPAEFHPLMIAHKQRHAKQHKAPITILKDVFVDGRMPQSHPTLKP